MGKETAEENYDIGSPALHLSVVPVEVMSENAPPVPPPPPPLSIQTSNHQSQLASPPSRSLPFFDNFKCEWASDYPELRKGCHRYGLCLNREPDVWSYHHFESLIQIGPTCGIVALSMCLHQRITPVGLLEIAKRCGYTNNGEMFSVKDMYDLLKRAMGDNSNISSVHHCRGRLSDYKFVQSIIEGGCMLVPYDSDCNHAPCLKNGHSAHWCLVNGLFQIEEASDDYTDAYVTAKHGKSNNLAIWKIKDLEESNLNLKEFSVKRANDDLTYVLPKDGLGGDEGLCGQFILINHRVNEEF